MDKSIYRSKEIGFDWDLDPFMKDLDNSQLELVILDLCIDLSEVSALDLATSRRNHVINRKIWAGILLTCCLTGK